MKKPLFHYLAVDLTELKYISEIAWSVRLVGWEKRRRSFWNTPKNVLSLKKLQIKYTMLKEPLNVNGHQYINAVNNVSLYAWM